MEVVGLRRELAEQEGARSGEKRLWFKLKALDHQLRKTQRDLEQTAEELAATRVDCPGGEQVPEAEQEVSELQCKSSPM